MCVQYVCGCMGVFGWMWVWVCARERERERERERDEKEMGFSLGLFSNLGNNMTALNILNVLYLFSQIYVCIITLKVLYLFPQMYVRIITLQSIF